MAACLACLEDESAQPIDRAAAAVYVATGGDLSATVTWGEVADLVGVEPHELLQTMLAARERHEAERAGRRWPRWTRRWRDP